MAGFTAQIPILHDGGHPFDPRHRHRIAGDVHHHQPGIDGRQRFDYGILVVRQFQPGAVGAFGVLPFALVESADEDHTVGILGRLHGVHDEPCGAALFAQVLAGTDTVVFAAGVAHVTAFIHNLGRRERFADAVERGYFMLGLQRRGTPADRHHLDGVLAHDHDFFQVSAQRQQATLVLQQHDALGPDLPGRGIMLGASELARLMLRIHIRAEDQAQHATRLVVEFRRADLAAADPLQIWGSQEIVVVGISLAHRQAVRPGAELHVQAVGDGLVGVVHSTPVTDHHAVEAPLALEDIIQQILVMAVPLALVKVIGAHDRPGAALLHGRPEGGQIDFVEGTVVDSHVVEEARCLLVVQRVVLHARRHIVRLDTLDIRNHHRRRQIRILAHIFEVAAAQRRPVDVHAGTQQHVFLAVARLFADALAIERGQGRIPRSRQGRQGREGGARVGGPARLVPFIPQDLRADAVRAVGAPDLRNAEPRHAGRTEFGLRVDQGYFLLYGQARKRIFHPLLQRTAFIKIGRDVSCRLFRFIAGDQRQGREAERGGEKDSIFHNTQS